jgi:uncharacterized protein (DUF2252 family)
MTLGHVSVEARHELGRTWRETVPFEGLGGFEVPDDRADPLDLLREQDATRVPELVPIRHGRMSASAFAFYRGSAAIMAADLAPRPRTGGVTQLCGDAHLANFGIFAAPDRKLVFDVNDFDETLPGPFEWDVLRLGASIVLAARSRGFDKEAAREAVRAASAGYRETMVQLAAEPTLAVWYARVEGDQIAAVLDEERHGTARMRRTVESTVDKARRRTSMRAAERLTEIAGGRLRFREAPPLISRQPLSALDPGDADAIFDRYRDTLDDDRRHLLARFTRIDAARKVVGVGSVGTQAYVVLLQGRDRHDPLVLQIKQAEASVLERHLEPSALAHAGHRVVAGQRIAQAASDLLLGWTTGPAGNEFYVRQLYDMKGSADLTSIRRRGLPLFGRLCGATLARAHARGGDPVAIAAYVDDDAFARAVWRFSRRYADRAERDHARLVDAINDGEIEAERGV